MVDDQEFTQRLVQRFTQMASKTSDVWYSAERWPYMTRLADLLEGWLEATPPQRILDLACGTGAPTVALALKGYRMTGLDLTPAMLDIAQRGAALKGATVEWICQDMRTLACREAFDHVMLRDVIFGVFEDERDDVDLLRRISAALKPGGRCFIEVYNKEFAIAHDIQGTHFYDQTSDRFVTPDPQEKLRSWKLYSRAEWEQLLAGQGLKILSATGWKWPKDPDPPPWRADLLVTCKTAPSDPPPDPTA